MYLIGEVAQIFWFTGGAIPGCPAVLIGACQLMSHSGQLVRVGGFPYVMQALHSLQLGEVRRRCKGIMDLSNRLLRRLVGLGGMWGNFPSISERSELSGVIESIVVPAMLRLWAVEPSSVVLACLARVDFMQQRE